MCHDDWDTWQGHGTFLPNKLFTTVLLSARLPPPAQAYFRTKVRQHDEAAGGGRYGTLRIAVSTQLLLMFACSLLPANFKYPQLTLIEDTVGQLMQGHVSTLHTMSDGVVLIMLRVTRTAAVDQADVDTAVHVMSLP
jgi:hypothetical protein